MNTFLWKKSLEFFEGKIFENSRQKMKKKRDLEGRRQIMAVDWLFVTSSES